LGSGTALRAQGAGEERDLYKSEHRGEWRRAQGSGEERDLYKSEHGMVLFFVKTWSCSLAVLQSFGPLFT